MSGTTSEGNTDMKSADQIENTIEVTGSSRGVDSFQRRLRNLLVPLFTAAALTIASGKDAEAQAPIQPRVDSAGSPTSPVSAVDHSPILRETVLKAPQPTPRPTTLPTMLPTEAAQLVAAALPTVTPTPEVVKASVALSETLPSKPEVYVANIKAGTNFRAGPGTGFAVVGNVGDVDWEYKLKDFDPEKDLLDSGHWIGVEGVLGKDRAPVIAYVRLDFVTDPRLVQEQDAGPNTGGAEGDAATIEDSSAAAATVRVADSGEPTPVLEKENVKAGTFKLSDLEQMSQIPAGTVQLELVLGSNPEINDIVKALDALGVSRTFYITVNDNKALSPNISVGMHTDIAWLNKIFETNKLAPEAMAYLSSYVQKLYEVLGVDASHIKQILVLAAVNLDPANLSKYYEVKSENSSFSPLSKVLSDLRKELSNIGVIYSAFPDNDGKIYNTGTIVVEVNGKLLVLTFSGETDTDNQKAILGEESGMYGAAIALITAKLGVLDGVQFVESNGANQGNPTVEQAKENIVAVGKADEATNSQFPASVNEYFQAR